MKYCQIIIVMFLLAGCSSNPIVYNPSAIKEVGLAKVVAEPNKHYNTWIQFVYNSENVEVTKRGGWDHLLSEVTLEPGTYRFKVSCASAFSEAYPEVTVKLGMSKKYNIYCSITESENILGMTIDAYAEVIIKEI
ncbi:MAG: hypothetical protein ACKVJE_08275 [Pseudomonadales bacterium]